MPDNDGTPTEPVDPSDFPFDLTEPGTSLDSLKFLVHGPPGVGKTYLCGSAADSDDMKPVLFIDTEGGTLTIRGKDVRVVRVRGYQEMTKLIVWLRKNPGRFKTIVFDSLTEFQKVVMQEIIRQEVQAATRPRDPEVPEQRDWQKSHERIRKVVRALRDLPDTHIIFTTLTREVKDEASGFITYKPALPGQLADEIAGFIDVVGYLHIERIRETKNGKTVRRLERRIQFQPGKDRIVVKDRSDNLGYHITSPTLPAMMEAIHAGKSTSDMPFEEEVEDILDEAEETARQAEEKLDKGEKT